MEFLNNLAETDIKNSYWAMELVKHNGSWLSEIYNNNNQQVAFAKFIIKNKKKVKKIKK